MWQKNSFKKENLATWIEIDYARLRKNLSIIRGHIKKSGADVMAVVKADAYGHGMLNIASFLQEEGVGFFAVATIDEAIALRKRCGQKASILVLGSFQPRQADSYVKYSIIPTVTCSRDAQSFETYLRLQRKKHPCHIKIDTGMGRLGVWVGEIDDFLKKISDRRHLNIEGVYTHFSKADAVDKQFTINQIRLFKKAVARFKSEGIFPKYIHAANSMGILRFKEGHFNLVRPGIILYGINPSNIQPLARGMQPILSLKARVTHLKEVQRGRTISYGATHVIKKKTRVATVSIGYSHGYRVALSNKGHVLIHGKRCPVIGRVTMDQIMVDVGSVKNVKLWDEVVLIGRQGKSEITAKHLADLTGTIPYEILCRVRGQ